jgi:molecular chaperone DnaK
VSAKDKATGKAQSIVIKASSGLSDDEIKNMVKDAETHAAEDRKFHELVGARNQGDNMIHSVTKSLKEAGDKVSEDERKSIEQRIEALKEALKGNDKDLIEAKTKDLTDASGKMAEKMYAAGQQQQGGQPNAEGQAAGGEQPQSEKSDTVVDAEFEEVKDDKK